MTEISGDLAVLMTVYNGREYLRTAIESILQQTYTNFHFLIVDDASTDDSREIVGSYHDPRIEMLALKENVGQTAALNIGLRHATQTWIARMDADDYSAPTRFEEQMRALEADPTISCLGAYSWMFRENHQVMDGKILHPLIHAEIKRELLRGSPLVHSSMIAKRCALLEVGAYDERYRYSADIELYERLMDKFITANLPVMLYGIRRHSSQGTRTNVAQNETIEIFSRKLSSGKYSAEEQAVLLDSLARFHVVLSHQLCGQGKLVAMMQSLWRGLRYSPKTFAWYFPTLFLAYILPEQKRAKLKGWLAQRRPEKAALAG